MKLWRPRGLTRPAGTLPAPLASTASWRIPSTPIERYRPLLRSPMVGVVGQAVIVGGAATVQLGPQGVGTRWYPVQGIITTSTGVNDASTCQLYMGTVAVANLIGATSYAGGGDTFGLSGHMMQPGDYLIAVWSGGNNGDTATLRVTGDQVAMVS